MKAFFILPFLTTLLASPSQRTSSSTSSALNGSEGGNVTANAVNSTGVSYVGTLFPLGASMNSSTHSCTANVIKSTHGNLILTAAHCTRGDMTNHTFVPGWSEGKTPYGVWAIEAAFVTSAWQKTQDPQHDFAILRVAPNDKHMSLQSVTGGVRVYPAPKSGTRITDVAYNDDTAQPVTCTAPLYYYTGYVAFDCGGFVGGSSGSGFIDHKNRRLYGVIGGLHQGGCLPSTSYSSTFGKAVQALIARAERKGAKGDSVVKAGSDGCE